MIDKIVNSYPWGIGHYLNDHWTLNLLLISGFIVSFFLLFFKRNNISIILASFTLLLYIITIYLSLVVTRPIVTLEQDKIHILASYEFIGKGDMTFLVENALNVSLFVPIGILLPLSISKMKFWNIVLSGFVLSAVIEFLQYYLSKGMCETDDVIHNTIGCALGYSVFYVSKIILKHK